MNRVASDDAPDWRPAREWEPLDSACGRFEQEWREGKQPDLATYLEQVASNLRGPLLRELVGIDLEWKAIRKIPADVAE